MTVIAMVGESIFNRRENSFSFSRTINENLSPATLLSSLSVLDSYVYTLKNIYKNKNPDCIKLKRTQ